ncbi:MAG: SurA N-terminal domain-containing protein [Prevotellaceae bacterium]|jgi:peptidyl-prolyl cis-trans isomerase D|nr:SurA N-terminal domain-containing protein [Prevotellaceae bacterium]
MATLETLRKKAGVFISAVIGLALLAFIINADTLTTARAIFSSDDDMGKIDGNTVSHEEFDNLLNYNTEIEKLTYNLLTRQDLPMTDETNERLRNITWQELIFKYIFHKEYDKIGLSVSEAELTDLTLGANVSPLIQQYFTNPETGDIDRALISNIVQNLDGDIKVFWIDLEQKIKEQQLSSRYLQLDSKSTYVNSLEVEHALESEKNNVEFSYILKDYASVADSLIRYKESDLKDYYNKHKLEYKETRSRDVEFVAFTVTPSPNDYERVMYKMENLQKQLDTIPTDKMSMFVNMNSDVPFGKTYYKKGQLPAVIDSVIFNKNAGDVLPYYQEGDSYSVTGIVEFKNLPDSVKAEHILLSQADFGKADSIMNLIKSGANFAELANQFSTDKGAAGGDLGWFDYDRMVSPFRDSCFFNPVGKLMQVVTNYGVHIVRITGAKDYHNKVLPATIKKNILPSKETYQNYFAQANKIAALSEGNIEKFREACTAEGLQLHKEQNVALDSKFVGQFRNASNLIHWMYRADEKDVSGVLEIDNRSTYIVAALTNIKNAGIAPFAKVRSQIIPKIVAAKKAEYLVSEISKTKGDLTSIDEVAAKLNSTVTSVSPAVNFSSSFIPTLRLPEYKLLGAVYSAPANRLSEPLAGESGVYLFTVTNVTENVQAQTPEAIKSRLESSNYYGSYSALIEKANIIDNRGKFY